MFNWWRVLASVLMIISMDLIAYGAKNDTTWMFVVAGVAVAISVSLIWDRPGPR